MYEEVNRLISAKLIVVKCFFHFTWSTERSVVVFNGETRDLAFSRLRGSEGDSLMYVHINSIMLTDASLNPLYSMEIYL